MASSTEPHDAALIGTILVSRYRLLRLIGAGGMGAVYEADTPTGERYAVKVLSEQPQGTEGSQTLARFIREAKVSSSLSNPHIVPTYDGGVDPGTGLPFLVMQLLYGEDLDSLVGRIGPLHPVVAARVALQAAKGLAAAHGAGFVHRDVKPSNLFLSIHGDQVTVKVCDFGLAKARSADQQLTITGSILGSPLYMAPEQIDNPRQVDLRADVWSLGMTLYQALAGLPALHRAATFSELAVAVTTKAVPHLQDAAPWVDPGLARVVHGALIRDLSARCPDVSALHHALVPYAGGSDQLTTAMLAPVPAELRRVVAPRADYPLMWSTAGGGAGAGSDTMDVSTDPLIGKQLGGRYTLARVIGRGGMGAVYEAHTPSGERVAVKIVGVMHQSQEAMARFVREARAAMSIKSPHVVRVLDADTDLTYRVPYIAMELLEGTDLDKLLKDRGPLEPRAAAALFREACEGLAAAHALGVVHRDIKPANLFLHQRADGTITLKLCDFGVAKQLSTTTESDDAATELTRTGGIVGSPMYMSPEQARNAKSVDHRTDVWSLAMTLHQALSGRKPWEGCSTVGELIVAICTQPPTPIQDLAPWVDPRLATVVHKALRRDPADRYASVRELSQALAPFAAPGPLTRERLVALSDEQREQALSRANYPSVRPATGGTTVHGAAMDSKRTPRSAIAAVIGVSFAVLVAGGAALAILRRPTDASPPPVASPAVGVPARVRGTVRVSPRTAIVVIGSSWREPGPGGEIELEGEPGEQITVAAAVGSSRVEVKCVLSRDGTVSPAVIEVPAAATPVVTAGGKPVASGGPQAARPTGAGGAAAVVATAVVPPTPTVTTPVATTAPTAPRPKDSW